MRRVDHSGIIEISGADKQETRSALVARIWKAIARSRRTSHLKLLGVLGDLREQEATKMSTNTKREMVPAKSANEAHRGDEGMVSGHKAEAASGHLMDTLCEANAALSVCREDGRKYSRSGITLAQVLRGVALRVYGTDAPVIGVYKLTNTVNGKAYVGKSVDIYARWATHKSASVHLGPEEGCRLLNNAVRKHGWKAFRKELLWVGTKHELSGAEVRLIAQHRTLKPLGYNITRGGEESPFINAEVQERANASKIDLWNARFEERLVGLSVQEAARQRRRRDGRLRAKHRLKAKRRGEEVAPISKEEASAARLAAANGEYATLLRKATYARKREAKRTGNLRANCQSKEESA